MASKGRRVTVGVAARAAAASALVLAPLCLGGAALFSARAGLVGTNLAAAMGRPAALALAAAAAQGAQLDVERLHAVARAVRNEDGVEYVYLQANNGSVALHTFPDAFPAGLTANPGDEGVREVALAGVPVVDVAVLVPGRGAVHVGVRRAAGEQHVASLRRAAWGWSAVATVGGLVGVFAAVALLIGRRARRLAEAAEAAGGGDLTVALSVSGTDELGRAGAGLAVLLQRTRESYRQLAESLAVMSESTAKLTFQATEQGRAITYQAGALHETQVTAEEIRQTSKVAAQKAEAVLKVSGRAEDVGKVGAEEIDNFIDGYANIRGTVDELTRTIADLRSRARQIGEITKTVKGLADQSNMVALNAAIEAVRSGEHGKGFAIVAGEVRNLADQSIHATKRVREILDDIAAAILQANAIAEAGTRALETGLAQVTSSGENIRELSGLAKDSSAAVRQIAAAVGQQHVGIDQIFTAINEMNSLMGDASSRLDSTGGAAAALRDASGRAEGILSSFRL